MFLKWFSHFRNLNILSILAGYLTAIFQAVRLVAVCNR